MSQASEVPPMDGAHGAFEGGRFERGRGCRHQWRDAQAGCHGWRGRGGHPLELVAIVLGFIVFWPIGLALLMWRILRNRGMMGPGMMGSNMMGSNMGWSQGMGWHAGEGASRWRGFSGGFGTGNSAFDSWKDDELKRLDDEYRKLVEAQKAFAAHIDTLRKAKDRAQFDEFMAQYNAKASEEPKA